MKTTAKKAEPYDWRDDWVRVSDPKLRGHDMWKCRLSGFTMRKRPIAPCSCGRCAKPRVRSKGGKSFVTHATPLLNVTTGKFVDAKPAPGAVRALGANVPHDYLRRFDRAGYAMFFKNRVDADDVPIHIVENAAVKRAKLAMGDEGALDLCNTILDILGLGEGAGG